MPRGRRVRVTAGTGPAATGERSRAANLGVTGRVAARLALVPIGDVVTIGVRIERIAADLNLFAVIDAVVIRVTDLRLGADDVLVAIGELVAVQVGPAFAVVITGADAVCGRRNQIAMIVMAAVRGQRMIVDG